MQDIELLSELKRNPNQGLERLIEQYAGLIYCIINGKLSSVGTAEDVNECVSDVFMEFYQQVECIDLSKGSIKGYLAMLAKHKGIDLYRKLARSVRYNTDIDEEWEQYEDSKVNLEQDLINKEQKKKVLNAIACLGEPDNEIFIRKYYLGQKTKEIAEILNLRENTVDKKISRGLKKLRILLGGAEYEREDNLLAK